MYERKSIVDLRIILTFSVIATLLSIYGLLGYSNEANVYTVLLKIAVKFYLCWNLALLNY